jgi:hypothetical protein
MTPKQFGRFLLRDGSCWHCGAVTGLIPHHRINRGMGGSKARHKPSNILVMCAEINGLMESDPEIASKARRYGWKLESWRDTEKEAVYSRVDDAWYTLKDDFSIRKHDGEL